MPDDNRTGSGDPDRTLQLLWGTTERPTRGPKPGLDVERVVAAAIELADEDGLEALSMRRVAERLGSGTMSLYRYIPSKAELLDLMCDRVLAVEAAEPTADGSWRARVTTHARAAQATYMRHPWLLEVTQGNQPALGPNMLDSYEALLAAVHASGLPAGETHAVTELIASYVAGATRAALERSDGPSDEEWWERRSHFWDTYFERERFPTMSTVYYAGGYETDIDVFEFGLERVLDGIEALLVAHSLDPTGP